MDRPVLTAADRKGEIWKIETSIYPVRAALHETVIGQPALLPHQLLHHRLAPSVLTYMLSTEVASTHGGTVKSDELGLPVTRTGLVLPCGASGRWESGK